MSPRSLERARYLSDNAAGEAFLPDGWRELVGYIPALIDAADALGNLIDLAEVAIWRVNEEGAYQDARKARDAFLPSADDVRGILASQPVDRPVPL